MTLTFDSEFEYTDILGWSVSRYNMFQTCKRQYFYHYYGKYDNEYKFSKIKTLKYLTSVPLMKGKIVHEVIEKLFNRLLVTERDINKEDFFKYTRKKCINHISNSTFAEVYYGDRDTIHPEEIYKKVTPCLKNFLESNRFEWIKNKAINYKNDWIIEPPNFGETRIENIKAYTKFDFLTPVEDKIYIIDWKSGQPDENKDRKQLMGYTTWACYHLDKNKNEITAILSYLKPDYSETIISMEDFDFKSFFKQVKKETYEMRDYCKNAQENIPKNKEVFMKTSNEFLCEYCNFRDLCSS